MDDKIKLLSMITSPNIEEILSKSFEENSYNAYEQNSHNTQDVDVKGFEAFCKQIFLDWREFVLDNYLNFSQSSIQAQARLLKEENVFQPEYIEKNGGFYNFIKNQMPKHFKDISPCNFQNDLDFTQNYDNFLHVFSSNISKQPFVDNIECRLYLNLKAENISKFVSVFYKKCKQKELPFYFKFDINDNRNDTFLVYSSYKDALKYIEVFDEIKAENPQLLEGTVLINQNLGKIKDYIGFGDEPSVKNSEKQFSYNSVREQIVEELLKIVYKEMELLLPNEKENKDFNTACAEILKEHLKLEGFYSENYSQQDLKYFEEMFTNNFVFDIKNLLKTGKKIENYSYGGAIKINMSKDWLAELKKYYNCENANDTVFRASLLRELSFTASRNLNEQEKNAYRTIHGIVKENLVKGLKDKLSHEVMTDEERKTVGEILNKLDMQELDEIGKSIVMISTANFIKSPTHDFGITLKNSKNNQFFNHKRFEVVKAILGEERIKEILEQKSAIYNISLENFHLNKDRAEEYQEFLSNLFENESEDEFINEMKLRMYFDDEESLDEEETIKMRR